MKRFKINIEYMVDKVVYKTNLFETEHFVIDYLATQDHIKLTVKPCAELENVKFKMTIPYEFQKDSRIFLNGYQSWTECKEYFINDEPLKLNLKQEAIRRIVPTSAYGDYDFVKYDQRKGYFHGFSYGYVRNGENFDLFGSLSERWGYTIIRALTPENEITFERELEGVVISDEYVLIDVVHFNGNENEVYDKYFSAMNIPAPRVGRTNGYTTWYNYYQNITEDIVTTDLEALSKVPAKIDIFQIDDGYQTAVGDWLSIDAKKFPNGMKFVADKIHEKGMKAGLWLAPLSCQYKSKVAKEHPEWIIRDKNGKKVSCGLNWGGFYGLDIENEEVRAYIKNFFNVVLNDWGYDMVKLDFLYSACVVPRNNKSRGQLMCEAMDFIRECVGDKLILGCGVPLHPAFGKVDYCRIGADIGLEWTKIKVHLEDVCTRTTLWNTIFRRGLDGRAFANDPDVFLLRDNNMRSTFDQRKISAIVNHIFGSLLFTSDNVGDYNDEKMDVLLHIFQNGRPKLISAEFITKNLIEIKYLENGEEKRLCFDSNNGELY